jgi:(p)ppGpp synthase/HD superfamily hydrolase
MKYTDELLERARVFAVEAHGSQMYGEFPYEKHLEDVVKVGARFGLSVKHLIACWLHDVIEDTPISFNKVEVLFGKEVAEMVYCVTDELGRDRKERKAKTLPKIAANPDAILVKLADRIANIESGGKIDMYAKEYFEFKFALYQKGKAEPMWEHLEGLLKPKLNTVGNGK